MSNQPQPHQPSLHVKKPCPKRWDELAGDDAQRYCSECSLHVLNSVRLTRAEAHALVARASERVCMRMELDPRGTPVFLDSPRAAQPAAPLAVEPAARTLAARATRWALGAAAGLLAACGRHETVGRVASTTTPPEASQAIAPLGEVTTTELLGDVACPPADPPALLGEVSAPIEPPTAPAPPSNDGDASQRRAR